MPAGGVNPISHNEVLRFEETIRICGILAGLGISTVRVTGGEPLVRKGVANFIKELKTVNGINRVTMTSNGVLLGEYLDSLKEAGLDAVNISLDTLDNEKFKHFAKGDGFENILPGVDKAIELGLEVKINCVPMKGYNEDDLVKLALLSKERKIAVRFIELMPLGAASSHEPLSADTVISILENGLGKLRLQLQMPENFSSGPAVYYSLDGFKGCIGIISAVSRCFCRYCNRLRLTSAGILKPCLSSNLGADLLKLVREGASDNEIISAVKDLVAKKPSGHNFDISKNNDIDMFRIGG